MVFLLIAAIASFFQTQAPARDRPNAPRTGTAVIRGRVVDGQTGNPVLRARVRLSGAGGPYAPAITDESGAFAFTSLPAGGFMLVADKATYVMGRYPEMGQTMRAMSRPVMVTDGQVVEGITIAMYRGGAIAGRIVDAHGDPMEGAFVQVMRLPKVGRARPQPRGGGMTNDIGEFRIAHLEPGRYLLFASPRRDGFMDAANAPAAAEPVESQPAPTFYPGVTAADQAQPIVIERGTSATGLELAVVETVGATVSGTVIDASGQPFSKGASINLRPVVQGVASAGFIGPGMGGGVRPDGTFRIRVPAGEYDIEARAFMGTPGPQSPGNEQFASARVSASGDVSGLVLQLGAGATISGRIVFDGSSPLPTLPPTANIQMLRPMPDAPNCRMGRAELAADFTFTVENVFGTCLVQFFGPFGRWNVKSVQYRGAEMLDQTFTFGAGQRVRDVQVTLSDKRTEVAFDVTDDHGQPTREFVGLMFAVDKGRWTDGSRYVRSLVPRSDQRNPLSNTGSAPSAGIGFVTGGIEGGVVTGGTVYGGGGVAMLPGVAQSALPPRPDSIVGLPAGDYFAIAVDDIEMDVMRDPDLLDRLSRMATRVVVSEDAKIDVTVRRFKLADILGDR